MNNDFQVEVVNDIGVIMRIQGARFETAEQYEPPQDSIISVVQQRFQSHLQVRGAAILGRMLAGCALQVVDSELGRRLQRDKWLIAVMASFTRNLNPQTAAREAASMRNEMELAPPPTVANQDYTKLVRSAVAHTNRVNQGVRP